MNTEEETGSVTLMILTEDLEPIEISSQLQLEPSQAWGQGEEKQRAVGTDYEWGGWKLISENKDLALEDQTSTSRSTRLSLDVSARHEGVFRFYEVRGMGVESQWS